MASFHGCARPIISLRNDMLGKEISSLKTLFTGRGFDEADSNRSGVRGECGPGWILWLRVPIILYRSLGSD